MAIAAPIHHTTAQQTMLELEVGQKRTDSNGFEYKVLSRPNERETMSGKLGRTAIAFFVGGLLLPILIVTRILSQFIGTRSSNNFLDHTLLRIIDDLSMQSPTVIRMTSPSGNMGSGGVTSYIRHYPNLNDV